MKVNYLPKQTKYYPETKCKLLEIVPVEKKTVERFYTRE